MSFLKKYKSRYTRLKFNFKFSVSYFLSPEFRHFQKTGFVSVHESQRFADIIKRLLRLNPCWSEGHFLLGVCSFRSYQAERKGTFRGTLRLCHKAISTLSTKELKVDIIKSMDSFCSGDFEAVVGNLKKYNDSTNLKYFELSREILGSAYLMLNSRDLAAAEFKKIIPANQDNEVKSVLALLPK